MQKDLTEGSVIKTVVCFSLPFMLAYLLQLLYGMADLFVIGRYCGVEATTAVANGSQAMHMVNAAAIGLAMGATVAVGRAVGAKDSERAALAVGNTITLFISLSFVLMAVLLFFVRGVVSLMATPAEAVESAVLYLKICFIGTPFIIIFNIIASIYRGLGDAKSPLYFAAAAAVANVAIDAALIGGMGMGPEGAAFATVISQGLCAAAAVCLMTRSGSGVRVRAGDFRPDAAMMRELLSVGVPIAFQDGLMQVSFITLTIIANMRGLNDAAAVGVVEKIIGVLFLVPLSMLSTTSALCAQSLGAEKPERARAVLRTTVLMSMGWGAAVAVVMQFASEGFVGLFTRDALVRAMGGEYMRAYIWDCIFTGFHFNMSGYFCACGMSGVSFAHNMASVFLARIPLAYLASRFFTDTLYPMGAATPAGSFLSVVICAVIYIRMRRNGK